MAYILLVTGLSYSMLLLLLRFKVALSGFKKDICITILCLILCVEIFYGWLFYTEYVYAYPFFLRLNTPYVLLIAPVFYLLTLEVLEDKKSRNFSSFWIHGIPFIFCFLYFIPLYLSPDVAKMDYINMLYQDNFFDSLFWGVIRRVQQVFYIGLILSIVYRKRKTVNVVSTLKNNPLVATLFWLFCLICLFDLYRLCFSFSFSFGVYSTLALSGGVTLILTFVLLSEKRFRSRKVSAERNTSEVSELSEESFTRIKSALEDDKLFLVPQITLTQFANHIDSSPHKASRLINEHFDKNFNELINSYRVQHVLKMFHQNAGTHFTLEAIARESGFGSTSSFNDNFKKVTGTTPSKAMHQIQQNS